MPQDSSPEHPQPLRWVAQQVGAWIGRLGWVWAEGQLIEINRRSGTARVFLTLRDKLGEVSVSVTTTPHVLDAAGPPPDGATVVARLKPRLFLRSGRLTFDCDEIRVVGEGMLLARLKQTQRMLQAEGLFDPRRKLRLPVLPASIGLVTAEGSAAERDVRDNVARRWPAASIVPAYALVQGPQAVEQLVAAVQRLDADPNVEVIIIARGGGSLEDLLPFSNETLIRTVSACRTPVVSAIGHETDDPILDLVADLRASTPTDAAKRVVPDAAEELRRVDQARDRLRHRIGALLDRETETLAALRSRPVMRAPATTVTVHVEQIEQLRGRLHRTINQVVSGEQTSIGHLLARCRAMSPKATLERGYALALDTDGHAVTSPDQVSPGDPLLLYVAEGRIGATVTESEKNQSEKNQSEKD